MGTKLHKLPVTLLNVEKRTRKGEELETKGREKLFFALIVEMTDDEQRKGSGCGFRGFLI